MDGHCRDMLTVMLLRHAKSDWSGNGTPDFERGLAPRGRGAAAAMGRYMAAHKLQPELVLCSPARRALETWELAATQLKVQPRFLSDEALYDFGDGENLLRVLQRCGGAAGSVLMVAHNPSLAELAQRLAGKGDRTLRSRLERKYPTAALAVIRLDATDWAAISDGIGTLESFVRPRDILAAAGD